jgi:predicted metal-binding membrane protein
VLGAVRTGIAHGGFCVGCCAGLMLVLFALGLMSLLWMTAVAAAIFAEKVAPHGERLAPVTAVALLVTGAWMSV